MLLMISPRKTVLKEINKDVVKTLRFYFEFWFPGPSRHFRVMQSTAVHLSAAWITNPMRHFLLRLSSIDLLPSRFSIYPPTFCESFFDKISERAVLCLQLTFYWTLEFKDLSSEEVATENCTIWNYHLNIWFEENNKDGRGQLRYA